MLRGILLFGLGIILGLAITPLIFGGSQKVLSSHQVREGEQSLINPLLECEVATNVNENLTPFKGVIQKTVDNLLQRKDASHISVYFRDLNNGPWFGINEKEDFIPASLLKVPIMISFLKRAETEPTILEKKITYEAPRNPVRPHFSATKSIQIGTTYTVQELLEYMIVYSDNEAKDLLVLAAENGQIEKVFFDLGVELESDSLDINVKNYASFFRILFNSSYLRRDLSQFALKLLSHAEFSKGLRAGVPASFPIAHKFGEKWRNPNEDKQLHDCGIIYYPGHPYLLCLMTRGDDFDALTHVLTSISRVVFEEVTNQAN